MTTEEVEHLKKVVAQSRVFWMDVDARALEVLRVGTNIDEPGPVAYFVSPRGSFAALDNCQLSDFKKCEALTLER